MTAASRPNVTRLVRRIIQDAARRLPELSHVKASRILVVAGEARRASWATVRPLGASKSRRRPVVRIKGRQMLYVITLRPRFFRVATPEKRVETILHEVFHISHRFDGSLHSGRRHGRDDVGFEKRLKRLVGRYLDVMPRELHDAIGFNGLVQARQWLEKPGPSMVRVEGGSKPHGRAAYSEKHLFLGPVQMITKRR
jgi:predicted metallopeptidase